MIKMYNVEVLSKFPVVQHFPFGSLFTWEQDPNASTQVPSVHTANQPTIHHHSMSTTSNRPSETTRAPWAKPSNSNSSDRIATTRSPNTTSSQSGMPATRAPWAAGTQQPRNTMAPRGGVPDGPTVAPWAKR
jgi:serine/threonine-protein phosphatase 2A activator